MRSGRAPLGRGILAATLLAACGGTAQSGAAGATAGGSGHLQPVPASAAATVVQENDELKFDPENVSVHVGDAVRWVDAGAIHHNVVFDEGTESPDMAEHDTYAVRFRAAGSYHYVCTYHPGMEGVITVR